MVWFLLHSNMLWHGKWFFFKSVLFLAFFACIWKWISAYFWCDFSLPVGKNGLKVNFAWFTLLLVLFWYTYDDDSSLVISNPSRRLWASPPRQHRRRRQYPVRRHDLDWWGSALPWPTQTTGEKNRNCKFNLYTKIECVCVCVCVWVWVCLPSLPKHDICETFHKH